MERLRAAWDEFWKSISWLEESPKVLEFLARLVPFVLIALGIGVIQAGKSGVEWASQINPLVLHILVLICAMYLTWHFAIAWHKTGGPIIWLGEPVRNEDWLLWD